MFTNPEALWIPPFWVLYGGFITLFLCLFVIPWTAACQAPPSSTIFWSLLGFMSIESVMPSNHHILCHPLCLSSVFPGIRSFPLSQLFTSGSQSIGALASASVLPMNIQCWFPLGLTGLISLLSKGVSSLLHLHNSKAIHQCLVFFMVQLSHPYMTTGKTVALTIQTSVGKVMSLLFNTLSRFAIDFFLRRKCLFKFHGCCHHLQRLCSLRK